MENEIFFGHFQYIRCMALIHDGGERRTPAVYRHDMTAPDGKVKKIDLLTAKSVEKIGLLEKFWKNLKYYMKGAK